MTGYRGAGVDLEGADRHVEQIGPLVTATWGEQVVGGFGGFASGIVLPPGYTKPVLMLSTDGVGTKLELARQSGRWEGVGFDLVAMCVDDLATAGATPLAMVDYLAVGALDAERDTAVVASVARACSEVGCALVGGETAEHPGVMEADQIDLAGTALGVVEAGRELGAHRVMPGDVVIGLTSPNLRSNGFSLVRRVIEGKDLMAPFPGENSSLIEVLMRASVLFTPRVLAAAETGGVRAAAHITGGGLPGNLIRALPEGCRAIVDVTSWEVPRVFSVIQEWGSISEEEMRRTFNMGIGFCLLVEEKQVEAVLAATGPDSQVIGRIEAGNRGVAMGANA